MDYYSAVNKKNEVKKFTSKWKKLQTTILSKVTLTQNNKHHMLSFTSGC